jgi:hypothetical protein
MANSIPIQFLRSSVAGKRPDPTRLLDGQPTVNTNNADPGMYVADSTGTNLIKIGPCGVGTSAPNAGASAPGALGNCKGELWLDLSGFAPILKVYDGSNWINCMPYTYAAPIVAATAPPIVNFPDNTQWWNSTNGLMYILYNDGTSRQWTQVTSSVSPV